MKHFELVGLPTMAHIESKTKKRRTPDSAFRVPRFVSVLIVIALLATMLSGCKKTGRTNDGKISVICSVFPQYDWARQILGNKADGFNLTLLQSSKVDLHSFHPSVDDILNITICDLFIYVGGESDTWADDALKGASNPDMIVINLLDTLGARAKEEEIVEGMEDDDDDDDGGFAYDEHVWLSLKNAMLFCEAIAKALSALDAGNAGAYKDNLDAYLAKLSALDAQYQSVVDESSVTTLLFGDRFPFRYLVDDYGLDYYAAFPGCSAETEASFKTIVTLAEMVDELSLNTVMVTESADKSIAKTIISNTSTKNQRIVVLDAMQSITLDDVNRGTTYLSIMESNLNALKEALK